MRRFVRVALCLSLIVAGSFGLSAGCIGGSDKGLAMPRSWAAGPSARVQPDAAVRGSTVCYEQTENVIRLTGSRNETVAFTFVLTAVDGASEGLEVSAGDLVAEGGVIGRGRFRMYRHWPILVTRFPNWYLRSIGRREPRAFPDVLVPLNAPKHGQPLALAAGESLPIRVEIRVPADAAPGVYRSHIKVTDRRGETRRTPLELDVRDVDLSPDTALPILARVELGPIIAACGPFDPDNINLALANPNVRRAIRRTFSILHEHGLSPYTDEVHPVFRQAIDGTMELDWAAYDEFCGPLIDGTAYEDGTPARAWPLPVDLTRPAPERFEGIDSGRYGAVLREYMTRVRDHFAERGWLDLAFVYFDLPARLDAGDGDYADVRKLATITNVVDPALPFVTRLIPQSMVPFGWEDHHFENISRLVGVWATPARYQHRPTLQQERALGKLTWLSPDRPPFSGSLAVEAPLVHARSLAWQAFLQGHDAVSLRHVTRWPDVGPEARIDRLDQPSDTWLLYPGGPFGLDEPVPSMRLKQIQLGLQDYQYLRLLDRTGHGASARLTARSLIKAAGTAAYGDNYQDGLFGRRVDDPDVWHLARILLLDTLVGPSGGAAGSGSRAAANQGAWREFLKGTRRIELWSDSARLRVNRRPGQAGYLVEFGVGLRSELPTPLSGTLALGLLPLGWHSISDLVRVGPVDELQFTRSRLMARTADVPRADLDGHCVQTIKFDGGASGSAQADALLSIVHVTRPERRIEVDGSLRDWPPAEANVAGDFRLITASGPVGRRRRRAKTQTVTYFCRQGDMLLIGVLAARPSVSEGPHGSESAGVPQRFGNTVRYEDLMPIGEDLVEILIDPTNSASRSDDLFHIVLKSSGQAIFERGVGVVPAIGRNGPWLARERWAVERGESSWSGEVAIPLAAFGPDAAESPIWGVNVARLEPVHGEYSDWAGAVRYCYDPRTLGNLVWPRPGE